MIAEEPVDIYGYNILDSEDEEQFDDLVNLASLICNCPISTITFIDPRRSRQWFKARKNMPDRETSVDISFCAQAVQQNDLLLVEDATKSELFSHYANVTGGMKIRFYAGSPVRTASGKGIGTLCVIDTKPRKLSTEQVEGLQKLANQASRLLELRLLSKRLKRKSDKLIASAESYKDFFDNSPIAQWIVDMTSFRFLAVNKATQELYGYTEDINQMLASTCLLLHAASSNDNMRLDLIERSQQYLSTTIQEVRRLSHVLANSKTKDLNLEKDIRELLAPYYLAKLPQINYETVGNVNALPVTVKTTLLRIIQESFQNISKYAQATMVEMKLVVDEQVHLTIRDNGTGFDKSKVSEGIGLKNIRERTRNLHGAIKIDTSPGNGCVVEVRIPLQ